MERLDLKSMKINWIDSLRQGYCEGYSDASNALQYSLSKKFNIIHNSGKISQDIPADLAEMIMVDGYTKNCSLYINNTVPDCYKLQKGYNVGFSYWETTKLPDRWIEPMNSCNEIWTTSAWAKNVFLESGVNKPIYEFKLGVDANLYFPPPAPRTLKRPNFTFMSIGSPSSRKNSQTAVDAFLKVFGNSDGYSLLYKSNGPPDARDFSSTGERRPLKDNHRIKLLDYQIDKKSLAFLYDEVDCLIYPTSGEGWGFLPLQAIAKGIPTICTNVTACTEYADLSVPLNYKLGKDRMNGLYDGCGEWAVPDFDDLCDKMLYVANNYDQVSKKTFAGSQWIGDNLTWDSVIPAYEERLCQILSHIKKKA